MISMDVTDPDEIETRDRAHGTQSHTSAWHLLNQQVSLSKEETDQLFDRLRANPTDEDYETLFLANLKTIAKAIQPALKLHLAIDFNDVLQGAFLKVWSCIRRFDPDRGRFTTFVYAMIRDYQTDLWAEHGSNLGVRLPTSATSEMRRADYFDRCWRDSEEGCNYVAKQAGVSPTTLNHLRTFFSQAGIESGQVRKGVERSSDDESRFELSRDIFDGSNFCSVRERRHEKMLETFHELLSVCRFRSKRGKEVIEQRLTGDLLETVGERLGVTRERIRQIQTKGIEDIRYCSESARGQPFMDAWESYLETLDDDVVNCGISRLYSHQ